jgi:fatty acid desaturase
MAEAIAMEGVPKELLRAAYQRKPIYLLKVPLHFALWGLTTWAFYATHGTPYAWPVGIVGAFFIANLIRGLGAVGHDAVHGNCFRSKTASYWFGLLCWAPTGMVYSVYSNYHLHHHRIANTYPDVDNFVVTDYTRNPFLAKVLLVVVYSFAYPALLPVPDVPLHEAPHAVAARAREPRVLRLLGADGRACST